MTFLGEKLEGETINEFAKIAGVNGEEVGIEADDVSQQPNIRLKAHVELEDEARDFDITIIELEKQRKYQVKGFIEIQGKGLPKKIPVDEIITTHPNYLPRALTRILNKYKVKRKRLGYF